MHDGRRPRRLRRNRRSGPPREVDIDRLTSKQRAYLRSLAHHLKPILQIGRDGVSDAVVDNVREAFNTHELLKVKLLRGSPVSVDDAADALRDRIDGVAVVQVIGRTAVLYRRHPEEPEIELPD